MSTPKCNRCGCNLLEPNFVAAGYCRNCLEQSVEKPIRKFEGITHVGVETCKMERYFTNVIDAKCRAIFLVKNPRYGNQAAKNIDEDGMFSAAIRLSDKASKFKAIVRHDLTQDDESIEDTLIDLINYAKIALYKFNENKVSMMNTTSTAGGVSSSPITNYELNGSQTIRPYATKK